MHSHSLTIDIAIFVAFLLINVIVGFRYRGKKQSFQEYAIGDKKFSTATLTATIVATWMSAGVLFVGLEQTYTTGLRYILAITVGVTTGLLITGRIIGPRMGKFMNNISVPEAIGSVYGELVQAIAGVSTTLAAVGSIAIQFQVIGQILTIIFGYSGPGVVTIAAIIITLYSISGGVKAVTFTDVFQFLTFGTLLPVLALVIWNNLADTAQVAYTLSKHPLFSFEVYKTWNPISVDTLMLIIYFVMPDLYPQLFQRIAMARDKTQVKRSLTYAAIVCLGVELCIIWIAILLLIDKPDLDPKKLVQYMVDTYTYPGLRGFLGIGVMALAMSTADSILNSCAVIIANDVLPSIGIHRKHALVTARWATIGLGVLSLCIALSFQDMLNILRGSANFYAPVVVIPMLLAVFGFETSKRVVLIAMGVGATVAASCLFYFKTVNSFFPGMLANLMIMLGAHYWLKEKGGWGNNPIIAAPYHKAPLSSQWKQWYQSIRQFHLLPYLEKRLPKQDQAYLLLAFYIFATNYAGLYLFPKEVAIQYPSLYKWLYYSVTLVITMFLAFPIWPQGLRAKRLLVWMWPASIFYTLFIVGSMLAILSGFEMPQLMLLMLNLFMTILFLDGPIALFMCLIGGGGALFILQQTAVIPVDLSGSTSTLQFRIVYGLLLFSGSLIALFKHQQAYRGLEASNLLLKTTQKETHQALLQALQHREHLAQKMRQESTQLFTSIQGMSEKLEQETRHLQDEQAIAVASTTLREANDKLRAASAYFNQIIYQVKDYMQLKVSTLPIRKLLQQTLQGIKYKQDLQNKVQVTVQLHTQQEDVQCDPEALQQLLADGIAYAQQRAENDQPILLNVADTTLGYPITSVKDYIKKVRALCITITTQDTIPVLRDLYMGAVSNTGMSLPRSISVLPLIRNQRIVDEHYGTTEFVEGMHSFTQLYIIPLRLREIRPATMDAPEIKRDVLLSSSESMVYTQEEDLVDILSKDASIDIDIVKKAIKLIKECHGQSRRKTGELFYLHPIAVAKILWDYTKDQDTLIAALLHDTVEDTSISLVQIGGMFNETVQRIVDGVTHLESNIENQRRVTLSAHENIQKLLGVDDNRVLYVKLADRLHNMRTIEGHKNLSKQQEIANETLQFFVPIARHLQINAIEKELQQLASQVLNKTQL